MLSYQHIYHAGCLADLHKHAVLCTVLSHMVQKQKPMSYIETHAGRGLYDLRALEAKKTGEAEQGVMRLPDAKWFAADHPFMLALNKIRKEQGEYFYAGSAALAAQFLNSEDTMHLHELHPQEYEYLRLYMKGSGAKFYQRDGYEGLLALAPPMPRRGLVFIDPSYEIKTEYAQIPDVVARIMKKWPVAVLCVWYPLLPAGAHKDMVARLQSLNYPKSGVFETQFMPQKEGSRGMFGSGLFMMNMPFGAEDDIKKICDALHMVSN